MGSSYIILTTKNSKSSPENVAGWSPQRGWLGLRWVGWAATAGTKSVHPGSGWLLIVPCHLLLVLVSMPSRTI